MAKDYEDLTITDDFMFGKIMEYRELCREMLECLLDQSVGKLQEVQNVDYRKVTCCFCAHLIRLVKDLQSTHLKIGVMKI